MILALRRSLAIWKCVPIRTKILYGLIAIGTLFRFFMGLYQNPLDSLFSDPKRHWINSQRLLDPGLMNGCDPIFYQIYLFLLQKITGENRIAVGLATGALSAFMPWTYYKAALALPELRSRAFSIWVTMLLMPSFFVIYRYFMIETVLLPLIGLGLWATGWHLMKRDLLSFVVMTFAWMCASLTKPAALPLAVVCVGYAWWQGSLHTFRRAAAAVGLTGLMMIPNAVRTYRILGYCAPLGSGWIAQIMHRSGSRTTRFHWDTATWVYSSPSCYVAPLYPLNHWVIKRAYNDDIYEVSIHKADRNQGWLDVYRRTPTNSREWVLHFGENMVLFLFAPSWPDSDLTTWDGNINYWMRWLWAPIIFYILFGNWDLFKEGKFPLVPVATTVLLLMLMLQNSVTMEGRYRKPLEPLLLLNLIWLASEEKSRNLASK